MDGFPGEHGVSLIGESARAIDIAGVGSKPFAALPSRIGASRVKVWKSQEEKDLVVRGDNSLCGSCPSEGSGRGGKAEFIAKDSTDVTECQ